MQMHRKVNKNVVVAMKEKPLRFSFRTSGQQLVDTEIPFIEFAEDEVIIHKEAPKRFGLKVKEV